MRVAIIGAGIVGLSAARVLLKSGHDVVLFEQGAVPNPRAASVDHHRSIRYPYGDLPEYMVMVASAFEAWDRLWTDLGQQHYAQTGTLVLATDSERLFLERSETDMRMAGHPLENLTAEAVAERFPVLTPDGITGAFWTPTGGVLFAADILHSLTARIKALGAEVYGQTPVRSLDPATKAIVIHDGWSLQADAVIVAAGAWTGELLPSLQPVLTPSRQCVVYLEPPLERALAWRDMPIVVELDGTNGFYALPPAGGYGMKVGDHRFSRRGTPSSDRTASPEEARSLLALASHRLVDAKRYQIAASRACYYTLTTDERFLVQALDDAGRCVAVSACSGHGFKFGALLGEAVAATVAGHLDAGKVAVWAAGRQGKEKI